MCHHCDNPTSAASPIRKRRKSILIPAAPATMVLPGQAPRGVRTHEQYVTDVVRLVLKHAPSSARAQLAHTKVVYGAGPNGTRGVCYYDAWGRKGDAVNGRPNGSCLVAICATGQESLVQICGTVTHELGHVLAGFGVGHGKLWLEACAVLGLGGEGQEKISAAGTLYTWDMFAPKLRADLQALAEPTDGTPQMRNVAKGVGFKLGKPKACGVGFGSRGGSSRGAGSGSRMLKWVCKCAKPQIIRHAGTELAALCTRCNAMFELDEGSLPAAHTGGYGHATLTKLTKIAAQAPISSPLPVTPKAPTATLNPLDPFGLPPIDKTEVPF